MSIAVGKSMRGFVPLPTSDAHARRELARARTSGVVRALISEGLRTEVGEEGTGLDVEQVRKLIHITREIDSKTQGGTTGESRSSRETSEGVARTCLKRLVEAGIACERRRGSKSTFYPTPMCTEQFAETVAPHLVGIAGARRGPPYTTEVQRRALQFWTAVDIAWQQTGKYVDAVRARTGRDVTDGWLQFTHKHWSSSLPIEVKSVFGKPRLVAILQVLAKNRLAEADDLSSRALKNHLWFENDADTVEKLVTSHLVPALLVQNESGGIGASVRQWRVTNATMGIVADVATPHLERARHYSRRMIVESGGSQP